MGYFDLIKKKEEEEVAQQPVSAPENPPELETRGNVQSSPQIPQSQPVANQTISGEDVFKTLLRNNEQEREADLNRRKKADVLGNLANLFGQSVALSQGARQFAPIKSNVKEYDNAIDRLKDSYNSSVAQYTLGQIRAKERADAQAKQNEYNTNVLAQKHQWDVEAANEKAKKDKELADNRAKSALELEEKRAKNKKELAKINNDARRELEQSREEGRNQRHQATLGNKGKGNSNQRSILVKNENGEEEVITYDKSREGAIVSLYNKMKKLAAENPGKYGNQLEDLELKFGEGGTRADKAMTIINQRATDFPELTEDIRMLAGGERPKKKKIPGFGEEQKKGLKKIEGW